MSDNLKHHKLREQVATTALSLLTTDLVVNTSGNVSIRVGDEVIITPSGTDYNCLTAQDICVITMNGDWVDGDLLSSSETPLHLARFARPPKVVQLPARRRTANCGRSISPTAIPTAATEVTSEQPTATIRVTTNFRLRVRPQRCCLQVLGGNFL